MVCNRFEELEQRLLANDATATFVSFMPLSVDPPSLDSQRAAAHALRQSVDARATLEIEPAPLSRRSQGLDR
jgi:hypothetical protein